MEFRVRFGEMAVAIEPGRKKRRRTRPKRRRDAVGQALEPIRALEPSRVSLRDKGADDPLSAAEIAEMKEWQAKHSQ